MCSQKLKDNLKQTLKTFFIDSEINKFNKFCLLPLPNFQIIVNLLVNIQNGHWSNADAKGILVFIYLQNIFLFLTPFFFLS